MLNIVLIVGLLSVFGMLASLFTLFASVPGPSSKNQSQKILINALRSNNHLNSISTSMIPFDNPIIYGTAWKKDRTTELVIAAVESGFRNIDTACQPKHYAEDLVGAALIDLYSRNIVQREQLFLQTKFTSLRGQDPLRIPYNINSSLQDQVKESFTKSCLNLKTDYIDSLILHSPMDTFEHTLQVWRIFEEFVIAGKVKYIGISNTYSLSTLQQLYESASIKPKFLQNRFYAETHYDKDIHEYCRLKGIVFQTFWTLTGNPQVLKSPLLTSLASKYGKTKEQIFYRYVQSIGGIPLSGTTSKVHMREDLDASSITLEASDVDDISVLLRLK